MKVVRERVKHCIEDAGSMDKPTKLTFYIDVGMVSHSPCTVFIVVGLLVPLCMSIHV